MGFTPKEERRRIFRNELYNLKELGYVTSEQYENVTEAHNAYFLDLLAKEERENEKANKIRKTEPPAGIKPNEEMPDSMAVQGIHGVGEKAVVSQPKPRPVKVRPKKTAEEIRERNISWSLNIGVIMLLIGGLFVATSNWETMTPLMKAGSIALVSALFYGIAYISYRVLKIEKTAFAFIVLGSLFLPIFTLSLGWFELLGPYLSFYGEGRFILGAFSSSILIPIYSLLAKRLSSRLFVWFTYISSTISASYFLRAIGLETDGFYLGLIVFNTLLIAACHHLKKKGDVPLFTKELVVYSQANLVLSTLLMLFFYENHVFNGFNMILTAVVYLSMIFVNGRKEYHFVFSAMFVYGAYQILDNWIYTDASVIGYALIGFVFLLVPRFIEDQYGLKKAFQVTSAAVSGLAFLYITAEGMLLRSETPSFILFAAYLMISVNFIYLANTNKNIIFRYLSPFFLASAMLEVVQKLRNWIGFENLSLPIYFIGVVLFILIGWKLKSKYLQVIRTGSRDVGMAIMLLMVLVAFAMMDWWELALMLALTGSAFYIMTRIDTRPLIPLIAQWGAALSVGLAAASFGEWVRSQSILYNTLLGVPGNFAIAGYLLLGIAFTLRKLNKDPLFKTAFFTAHGLYAAALLFTFTMPIANIYGESFIWLGGIMMSVLLYKTTKVPLISYLTGAISLAWYIITVDSINEEVLNFITTAETIIMPGGGWLLLVAAALLFKRERKLSESFAWLAHIYLSPIMALNFMMYRDEAMWSYLIATGIYAAAIFFVKQEWKVKFLLYAAFTTLFLAVKTGITLFTGEDFGHYAFLTASILIAATWFMVPAVFKQRSLYYLVPFSLLGVASFLGVYPYSWIHFGITIAYAAAILILLHRIKWDLLSLVPLLMVFYGTIQFIYQAQLEAQWDIAILAGFGIVLTIIGIRIYPNLWEKGGASGIRGLDSFTIVAFLFFVSIATLNAETYWAQIIHGLLLSAGLWLQRGRVHGNGVTMLSFISGAYLLVPYYAGVEQFEIPALWKRELFVLPFVALVVFLRYISKGKWDRFTGYIQWGVLIIVSLILIQDGQASNTVYDALILGSLSLISMLAGMWLRLKAYFFVGAGVLLLNVVMQTRPFWGNLPWWGYLLVAGSILISVASFNEWNKQKGAKGEKTFLIKIIEDIRTKLKNWS